MLEADNPSSAHIVDTSGPSLAGLTDNRRTWLRAHLKPSHIKTEVIKIEKTCTQLVMYCVWSQPIQYKRRVVKIGSVQSRGHWAQICYNEISRTSEGTRGKAAGNPLLQGTATCSKGGLSDTSKTSSQGSTFGIPFSWTPILSKTFLPLY